MNAAYGATLEEASADEVTFRRGFTYLVPLYEATETVPVAPAGVLYAPVPHEYDELPEAAPVGELNDEVPVAVLGVELDAPDERVVGA